MDRDTSRTRRFGRRRRMRIGQRGLEDGQIGGGKARKDGAWFDWVWISRRRLGYGRGRDDRLGQIEMGRRRGGYGAHWAC